MRLVRVIVLEENRNLFSHKSDHIFIGIVFQEEEEHIYIKPFKRNVNEQAFIGSVTRYPKHMIIIENINEEGRIDLKGST